MPRAWLRHQQWGQIEGVRFAGSFPVYMTGLGILFSLVSRLLGRDSVGTGRNCGKRHRFRKRHSCENQIVFNFQITLF